MTGVESNRAGNMFENATMDDISADPNKFGAPTYEQYLKNPDMWQKHFKETAKLDLLDNPKAGFMGMVKKVRFYVKGHFAKSIEKAEKIAQAENIDLRFYRPELIDIGGGAAELHIHFDKTKETKGHGLIVSPP